MGDHTSSGTSVAREAGHELTALRAEWGHAYWIWFEAAQFCACRKDNDAVCRQGTADGLRTELRWDSMASIPFPGPPGSPAHALQVRFPSYRIGLDLGTLAWVATAQLTETARGFWYGPGLAELALKLGDESSEAG